MNSGAHDLSQDPQLSGAFSGNTYGMFPNSGSPAIDAGDNTVCPSSDYRGLGRPGCTVSRGVTFPGYNLDSGALVESRLGPVWVHGSRDAAFPGYNLDSGALVESRSSRSRCTASQDVTFSGYNLDSGGSGGGRLVP